ncbi:acetyl-CoA synthetase-like protein [Rhizodiscina lignyota]|uniref:Acetyl-CoA synthetase-like protein n=1 Tax=Rhizodiscina lignyota TaxID=1504668 RepID=A0A9P4M0H6_9PEZI|nr:acetyl-CoA synthetase-like protein [Rhizodiscina lignyota]
MVSKSNENAAAQAARPLSIVYGPSAPVPLYMTFGQLLDYHSRVRGDRPAVISHPQNITLSFRRLQERSLQLARAMAHDGVRKGDLIAIAMGSRVEYFEVFFACAYLGAAAVLLNYAYAEAEMVTLLKIIGPKMFFAPAGFAYYDYTKLIPKLDREIPELNKFIILKDIAGKYEFSEQLPKYVYYENYMRQFEGSAEALLKVDISPHDMVNVQFTSGSTGLPKNVALSHYNIMNCGRYIWQQVRMTDQDRVCLPVPLFHSFGMIVGVSSSTVAGSALVLPSEIFNTEKTLECIEKYRCTAVYGVPTMFVTEMGHKDFEKRDRSSIKFGIIAGAAMPPELLKRIVGKFPIPRLYTCWGMTELSSFVTMMHETDPFEKRIQTAGRLFPNYIGKIVKPNTGEVLPWGDRGEIVISGPGQMLEYMRDKKKTDETLRYHQEDLLPEGVGGLGDGTVLRRWMHTGDEGFLDPDGYFVISGRIKDIVIRGGENISPMEIEERLIEHDAIAQASVIGVPDEKYGEELGAFVELQPNCSKPSDDEMRSFVREKLARFKAPRYFWWIGGEDKAIPEDWPKTASGKISKPHLRELVKGMSNPPPEEPAIS